jgi:hypothetical protein
MERFKSKCKQKVYEWDVYLAHASEDRAFVLDLAAALRKRGLRVWIDVDELIVGRSIRSQLDHGLARSRFGVVVISENFFAVQKRWPQAELDGLFSAESDGSTRILPVWLNVDFAYVQNQSAILSARLGSRTQGDAALVAKDLRRSIERIYDDEGTWGQIVRLDTRNLMWHHEPHFFSQSLRLLDEDYETFWDNTGSVEGSRYASPLAQRVPDLASRTHLLDGVVVAVSGWQIGPVQLLYNHSPHVSSAEYVFQLKDGDYNYDASLVYVRCVGPLAQSGYLPTAPDGHFTTALGVPIASGVMTLTNGVVAGVVYVVAARIWHTPLRDSPSRLGPRPA